MPQLLIEGIDDTVLDLLRERANQHSRTAEAEAKAILSQALHAFHADAWTRAREIRERLAATGNEFSDSADLVREDRGR